MKKEIEMGDFVLYFNSTFPEKEIFGIVTSRSAYNDMPLFYTKRFTSLKKGTNHDGNFYEENLTYNFGKLTLDEFKIKYPEMMI